MESEVCAQSLEFKEQETVGVEDQSKEPMNIEKDINETFSKEDASKASEAVLNAVKKLDEEPSKGYQCDHCGVSLPTEELHAEHIKEHLMTGAIGADGVDEGVQMDGTGQQVGEEGEGSGQNYEFNIFKMASLDGQEQRIEADEQAPSMVAVLHDTVMDVDEDDSAMLEVKKELGEVDEEQKEVGAQGGH
eukprot:Seg438.9 transcript_id=Seg438.9/GoldUCD/mRNA.D3Y31 product="hypothetical protein" protein_id=Seg438.9/GoldUCD/D3Y31